MTAKTPQPNKEQASSNAARFRDACFAFNLRRAARIVTRRYETHLRPLGMTAFQFTALAALDEIKIMPQAQVAGFFGMEMSTASRNIAAMKRKGWVEYVENPEDGRTRHISLTTLGRDAFQTAIPLWEAAQAETGPEASGLEWEDVRDWLSELEKPVTKSG